MLQAAYTADFSHGFRSDRRRFRAMLLAQFAAETCGVSKCRRTVDNRAVAHRYKRLTTRWAEWKRGGGIDPANAPAKRGGDETPHKYNDGTVISFGNWMLPAFEEWCAEHRDDLDGWIEKLTPRNVRMIRRRLGRALSTPEAEARMALCFGAPEELVIEWLEATSPTVDAAAALFRPGMEERS